MKKILIVIFLTIVLWFGNAVSVEATDNLLKTQTNDKVIFVNDNDGTFGYSWAFDKNDFNNNDFEFDLGIKFTSDKQYQIEKIVGSDIKKEFISFDYHGALPSSATIKIPVDKTKFKDNDVLHLYYFNEEQNSIEEINSRVKVKNGYVTFDIEHCSDYFLTMSIVKEAEKNGNSKINNGVIIIGMLVVIITLVGYTLIKNKK